MAVKSPPPLGLLAMLFDLAARIEGFVERWRDSEQNLYQLYTPVPSVSLTPVISSCFLPFVSVVSPLFFQYFTIPHSPPIPPVISVCLLQLLPATPFASFTD